jgi:L-threonylcarbamoyladenylate synthase
MVKKNNKPRNTTSSVLRTKTPKALEVDIRGKIAKELKRGKVIVCPTDTVYGLIADATNKKAVGKVFKIKKRPINKPISIFVKDIKMAKKLAKINRNQENFLKSVWPGKVTVILKPKRKFPKGVGRPEKEIGLRIPDYKIINQLLSIIDRPLTGTSANISGKPASTMGLRLSSAECPQGKKNISQI